MGEVFVYRDGVLVPKRNARPRHSTRSHNIISDIQPFVTQEGEHISSRKALREYEQRNGVRQVGNDWTGPQRPPFWDRFEENRKRKNA